LDDDLPGARTLDTGVIQLDTVEQHYVAVTDLGEGLPRRLNPMARSISIGGNRASRSSAFVPNIRRWLARKEDMPCGG
jgi:hypothetical protein